MNKDIIDFIKNEITTKTTQTDIAVYGSVNDGDTPEKYIAHICWSKQLNALSTTGACVDIRFVNKDNVVLGSDLITKVANEIVEQINTTLK